MLKFKLEVSGKGETPAEEGADAGGEEGSQNKLEGMIKELSSALTGVKHEQDYMQVDFKNV